MKFYQFSDITGKHFLYDSGRFYKFSNNDLTKKIFIPRNEIGFFAMLFYSYSLENYSIKKNNINKTFLINLN